MKSPAVSMLSLSPVTSLGVRSTLGLLRDLASDVGSQEQQDNVEVVHGTGQHLPAKEIECRQHLIGREKPLIPLAQLKQVADHDWPQEDRHTAEADAGQLEDGEEDQLARNGVWNVGLAL